VTSCKQLIVLLKSGHSFARVPIVSRYVHFCALAYVLFE